MLHGYMSCKESFYYQIEYLSKSFKVTAPDLPGFGASAPLTAAWSVS
ncbi:MAG TPA: alpha/beta hydrolase, partial [Clostridiales bacterium]|nr:alpha/beta hydrolase [Clostridiales bacterium]